MRFSEYMQEWLYGESGYYRVFRDIGKDGDFYTAVSSSRLFGASIGNFIYSLIEKGSLPKDATLIEIGAHKGYLISDVIDWLNVCDGELLKSLKFGIVERQADVREIQRDYLANRLPSLEFEWFETLEDVKKESVIFISNEIFDAFSCELFKDGKIATVKNHKIVWEKAPEDILDFASRYSLKRGEIAIGYEEFAKRVANSSKNIEFISFDYGEKYVRNDFSIRIYKNHKTYPLFDDEVELEKFFKVADITYDVNFAHLIDAFRESGFELESYKTQAKALIDFGLTNILEQYYNYTSYENYLKEVNRVKTLISPTIMGDKFKMVHFSKKS